MLELIPQMQSWFEPSIRHNAAELVNPFLTSFKLSPGHNPEKSCNTYVGFSPFRGSPM